MSHNNIAHPTLQLLHVSIARFTYVPDEHYDTIEAAFAAKPLADWTALVPQSQFSLVIEQSLETIIMKCLDGQGIHVHSAEDSELFG